MQLSKVFVDDMILCIAYNNTLYVVDLNFGHLLQQNNPIQNINIQKTPPLKFHLVLSIKLSEVNDS